MCFFKRVLDIAMDEFNKIAVGDSEKRTVYQKKVSDFTNDYFDNFKRRKFAESD